MDCDKLRRRHESSNPQPFWNSRLGCSRPVKFHEKSEKVEERVRYHRKERKGKPASESANSAESKQPTRDNKR